MERLGFHWAEFHEIWYSGGFLNNSVEGTQVGLKKRSLHAGLCTFVIIPRWILLIFRNDSGKICRKYQNTYFLFNLSSNFTQNRVAYEFMWIKYDGARQTTKAARIQTHSQYVIFINFNLPKMVTRTRLNVLLHLYCHCFDVNENIPFTIFEIGACKLNPL